MISLENVSKKFGTGVFGLSDISFAVEKGEFVFLVGPTGSGKTTILRLLTREMLPSAGTIVISSWDLIKLPSRKIPELRKKIGVIFQDLKLLADRTILENTVFPLDIAGISQKEAIARAEDVLTQVGILEHKDKFPVQLSGGELQRAAIARALILAPEILLADEPTGNLDDETSWEIVKLLSDINAKGTTIIMATHNKDIVRKLNKRIIELNKGSIVNDKNHHKVKTEEKAASAQGSGPLRQSSSEASEPKEEKKEKEDEKQSDAKALDDKHEKEHGKHDDGKLKTDDFEEALKK